MVSLLFGNCRSLLDGKSRSAAMGDGFLAGKRSFSWLPNGQQKKKRTCRRLTEAIPALIDAMRQISCQAEHDFLTLGEELQSIYTRTAKLAKRIVAAISTIESDDGSGILHELQALIRERLANLAVSRNEAFHKQEILGMITGDVAGLGRYCEAAEQIVTYLTVIGFNIRIESSQKEEFAKLFGVIVEEIGKSSGQITEIIGRIRDDSNRLCQDQSRVSGKIAADLAKLGNLAAETDRLVNRAFGQIEELIGLACAELGRAGEQSATLTTQVGEIVMGIQLQDSMNQRIEHVIEALEDMERMVRGEAAVQPASMLDILHLQQAQLQCLASEVETAHARTLEAFESIGTCVDQLTEGLAGFSDRNTDHGGDPFGQLAEAFRQLDALLATDTSLITDIDESAEKTAESAGTLSQNLEQIQDISFQTRLIGLNSIIKAAHLGEQGQTLDVLSNQLTDMTGSTDQFVGAVERIIGSINDRIEQIRQRKTSRKPGDSGRELVVGEVVTHCTQQYDSFQEISASVGIAADVVKRDLAQARSELEFLDRLRQELLGLVGGCSELAALLEPWAGVGQKDGDQYRHEIAARYTMHQEREIHANMKSQPAGAAVFVDERGLQDEIELFTDDEPSADAEMIPVTPNETGGLAAGENEVGLFDDNVELF